MLYTKKSLISKLKNNIVLMDRSIQNLIKNEYLGKFDSDEVILFIIGLTVQSWIYIDDFVSDYDVTDFLFDKIKYLHFDSKWHDLIKRFYEKKASDNNKEYIKVSESILLDKILLSVDNNLEKNHIKKIWKIFSELERYVHINKDYSYFLIKIFMMNKKDKIRLSYPTQNIEWDYLHAFENLKSYRNNVVHIGPIGPIGAEKFFDYNIKSIENWSKYYWTIYKEIWKQIIFVIRKSEFVNYFQKSSKKI